MNAAQLIEKRAASLRSEFPGASLELHAGYGPELTIDEGVEMLEGGESIAWHAFDAEHVQLGQRVCYATSVTVRS